MATRAIVTSQPVVACDVCGRRLLRGETPDVFLAGGHSRTVCELCVPRATAEGWLREADRNELGLRAPRPRRTGSLLGRLRQLREPEERPPSREAGLPRRQTGLQADGSGLYEDVDDLYEFVDGGAGEPSQTDSQAVFIGAVQAEHSQGPGDPNVEEFGLATHAAEPELTSGEMKSERALKVFNAGATPQRVASVSRSLGAPTVTVRLLQDAGARVAIVVAWELCWYRYEVDLGDEAAGAVLAAEGMELDELPDEDRLANAAAGERGELALIAA
ncbi:MAG TPA: hypothetical protein VHS55_04975 [Solirubrobacteraceae bacterium]|jgi:hypothetical protein|nr:hypothetical protein [Solirubrobacteraceae bacterium]